MVLALSFIFSCLIYSSLVTGFVTLSVTVLVTHLVTLWCRYERYMHVAVGVDVFNR